MPASESHRASELVGSIITGMGKWFGIDVPQHNLDYNIRRSVSVIVRRQGIFCFWDWQ